METYPNDLKHVPTDMETDPQADEQIIDQTGQGAGTGGPATQPQPVDSDAAGSHEPETGATPPADELANALANAIDGSGTAGAPPVAPLVGDAQKLTTEGIGIRETSDEEQ